MIGNLVISKCGHDKDKRYIIIEEDGDFVYLADGRLRTTERLKKKRKKHIQPIYKYDTTVLTEKLSHNECVSNEEIKRIIKLSQKEERSKEE
jgi:ribosomal protein L14E/L6E/L27E